MQKRPLRAVSNAGDYRASLVRGLVYAMINARFTEIARRADAPFLGASVGEGSLGRDVETLNASARVNDGGIEKGLEAVALELARVRQHGFGRSRTRPGEERPGRRTRESGTTNGQQTGGLASELVRHFLNAEPAPGIVAELDLSRRFIATITTADAAAVLRDALKDDNRVVIAVSPAKAGIPEVTEARLRTALDAGAAATVEPWRDDTAGRELLAKHPTGRGSGAP